MHNCKRLIEETPALTGITKMERSRIKFGMAKYLALWSMVVMWSCAQVYAQTDEAAPATVVSFLIEGEVVNGEAGGTVALIESFANAGIKLAEAKVEAKGDKLVFTLAGNVQAPGVYYIGTATRDAANPNPAPVLLTRGAAFMKVKLIAGRVNQIQFEGSEVNTQYQKLLAELQTTRNSIQEKFATQNPTPELQAQMAEQYKQQERTVLSPYTQSQNMVGTLARLMLISELSTDPAQLPEETKRYWKDIDLTDGTLGYYPMLISRMAYFANALLTQVGIEAVQAQAVLDKLVALAPTGSRTELALLMGSAAGVQAENPGLFVHFGTLIISKHPTQPLAKQLVEAVTQAQEELTSNVAIGKAAPEIVLPDVKGETRKLSELKGKYVLIDFWASWCRPCRLENPNVKKAYAEYAPKGFEIFGVSIDENHEAWLKAIQTDGITWPQVISPGWESATAKKYGVQGIPFTLLLDKQGNILARNLRGAQLTTRLKKLLP